MSGYAIANPTYAEFLHSLSAWECSLDRSAVCPVLARMSGLAIYFYQRTSDPSPWPPTVVCPCSVPSPNLGNNTSHLKYVKEISRASFFHGLCGNECPECRRNIRNTLLLRFDRHVPGRARVLTFWVSPSTGQTAERSRRHSHGDRGNEEKA